jgi:predicted nucleotidyltransferase
MKAKEKLMQHAFIEEFTEHAAAHPGILAVWLEGSFGRGNADRYSDVDLHVLVPAAEKAAFQAESEAWLSAIRPLVLCKRMFDGDMINAMTMDGLRLDVWIHAGERIALNDRAVRVLVDKGYHLDLATPDAFPSDAAALAAALAAHITEFWRMISLLPTVIGRGELIVTFQGVGFELMPLSEVLMAQAGTQREAGVKRLNDFLLDETRRELEAALRMEGLSRESLVRVNLRLAELMRRAGPQVAAAYGFAYPHALEQTVLRYVANELRHMQLTDCLAEPALHDIVS